MEINKNVTNKLNKIIDTIRTDKNISAAAMAAILKVSRRTILRDLDILKGKDKIKRMGSEKSCYWERMN